MVEESSLKESVMSALLGKKWVSGMQASVERKVGTPWELESPRQVLERWRRPSSVFVWCTFFGEVRTSMRPPDASLPPKISMSLHTFTGELWKLRDHTSDF